MGEFSVINILDLIDSIGENDVIDALKSFRCSKNKDIEDYLSKNAIDFSKRKISITHLVLDEQANIVGYFALTHKPMRIPSVLLSNSSRKKIERYTKLDETTNSYDASAFLIAQFGKNTCIESNFTGNQLMDIALDVLLKVQKQVGGGIVFLECEDNEKLLSFYQNSNNRFAIYGERFSQIENKKYKQLLRLF